MTTMEFTNIDQPIDVLPQLSATEVQQRVDVATEQQITLNETVSAILNNLRGTRLSLNNFLTSVPTHPYEKLKHEYLNTPECSANTFENLPPVTNFNQDVMSKQLSAIREKIRNDFQIKIPSLTSVNLLQQPELMNVFSVLSGEKYVVDKAKVAKHLQHIEMIKSIPLDQIQKNPIEIAQKVITHFIATHS